MHATGTQREHFGGVNAAKIVVINAVIKRITVTVNMIISLYGGPMDGLTIAISTPMPTVLIPFITRKTIGRYVYVVDKLFIYKYKCTEYGNEDFSKARTD